jgi:hypothetical protein
MYSKEQLIEFANYCISNIASDKSQETIFEEWESSIEDNIKNGFLVNFSKLKSPYSEQAIENYDPYFSEAYLNSYPKDIDEALNYGFDWKTSPQGVNYWMEVCENIEEYTK